MSLVVSDSGPVHYLILCGAIEVIPKIHGLLVMPGAVVQELSHPNTPAVVSQWIKALPQWASIQTPSQIDPSPQLGRGEREAIALALELKATHLLVDDRAARRVAAQRGILAAGTVGILEQAARGGFVNLPEAMLRLSNTNFRIGAEVIREMLARDAVRRKAGGSVS